MNNPQRNPTERHRLCAGIRSGSVVAGLVGFLLCFSPSAFAYLDPSTGSMVVSAIVGIFASIALAVKTYWYKIKGFFKRDGRPSENQDTSSRDTAD